MKVDEEMARKYPREVAAIGWANHRCWGEVPDLEKEYYYEFALEEIIELMETENPSYHQSVRLENLAAAVEAYENTYYPIPEPDAGAKVAFRMEQLNIYPWANCTKCGLPLTEEVIDHSNEKYIEDHADLCCDCFDETFMKGDKQEDIDARRIFPRDVCRDHDKLFSWLQNILKTEENEARREGYSAVEALIRKRKIIG